MVSLLIIKLILSICLQWFSVEFHGFHIFNCFYDASAVFSTISVTVRICSLLRCHLGSPIRRLLNSNYVQVTTQTSSFHLKWTTIYCKRKRKDTPASILANSINVYPTLLLYYQNQPLVLQWPVLLLSSPITVCSIPLSDVANVIRACYGETPPPIVLIGHGVGGAIAVHTASSMLLPTTVGLVAIDVVEGKGVRLWAVEAFLLSLVFFSFCRQCNGGTPQHTELPEGKTQVLQVHGSCYRVEVSIKGPIYTCHFKCPNKIQIQLCVSVGLITNLLAIQCFPGLDANQVRLGSTEVQRVMVLHLGPFGNCQKRQALPNNG